MSQEHQYDPESDSLSFPQDTLVGIVNDPRSANAMVDELLSEGVAEEDIQVLCGESGARQLDPAGEEHGVLGRLQRLVQHFGDEDRPHVERQAKELRAGHFLVAVPADDDDRDRLAEIMKRHGGHFLNHYARWRVTRLEE